MAEETLIHGQQTNEIGKQTENVTGQTGEIVNAAMGEIKGNSPSTPQSLKANNGDNKSVAEYFKGFPMRKPIAAPLLAATEAQQKLISVAWDFYQRIAFYGADDKKQKMNGEEVKEVILAYSNLRLKDP